MRPDELRERTRRLALAVLHHARPLFERATIRHAAEQASRSSSSMAVNYRAACLAQSRAAFIAKLSIALEEADETLYWLDYITEAEGTSAARTDLVREARELTLILAAARRTARRTATR
jgi:four helix bundle protein